MDTKKIATAAAVAAIVIVVSSLVEGKGWIMKGAVATAAVYFGLPLATDLAASVAK